MLYKDNDPIASLPSLMARSPEDDVAIELRNIITVDFAKEMLNSLNFADVIKNIDLGDLDKGLKTFSFDTPYIGNHLSFHVERNADEYYIIKGVLNFSAIPFPDYTTQLDALAAFNDVYNQYQTNQNRSTKFDPYFFSPNRGDAFIGFRLFVSGRAKYVYDKYNNATLLVELNDAGGIAELSGKMTNSITYLNPLGLSIKGSYTVDAALKGILSIEHPTKEYLNTKIGKVESGYVPINYSMESVAHAGITAKLGAGPDIWIASLYVGIQGGASFDWKTRVVTRPYLDNSDIDHTRAGSMLEAKANIGLFATKQFLFYVDTTKWDFAKWNYTVYSPDDNSNPYKISAAGGLVQ